jgi:rSAM/selenodomain-associated transferase 1
MGLGNHLVIFVKAPRLGTVKRRLADDIGAVAATTFYRQTTRVLLHRLGPDRRWHCWLAVTPDRDAGGGRFWPAGISRLRQGGGDLGWRMARPLSILPPGPVVIIGSDIPGILPRHIAEAFRALGRHDAVFGPAEDGGYWLVGLRRRPRPTGARQPGIFKNVRWSSKFALADTIANLGTGQSAALLETLADIDDGATFRRWRNGGD